MKPKVLEALIGKEENRVNAASRELKSIEQQYHHLRSRIQYVEQLLDEYASTTESSRLQSSNYKLQLYSMREKLNAEADILLERSKQIKKVMYCHYGEIRKFNKIRMLSERRHLDQIIRAESQQDDERGTMQFNAKRPGR